MNNDPSGVGLARQWAVQACVEIDRPDLVACAQLAVSELVTNALVHGAAPVSVRLRGTVDAPRIEVRDSSPELPVLPQRVGAGWLATSGRGLALVARASVRWGIDLTDSGKTVWFVPAPELSDAGLALMAGQPRTLPLSTLESQADGGGARRQP